MDAFNELTPAQAERLALLLEELGEAQQAVGKILRHGYESFSPFDETKTTNRAALEKELGDVWFAMNLLTRSMDLSCFAMEKHSAHKAARVQAYLHHQPASLFSR